MKEYILCVVYNDGTTMPGKKFSKQKNKSSSNWFSKGKGASKNPSAQQKINWAARSKGKMDVTVKKATYSKAARLSVLASATARQRLIEMGGENTIDIIREFEKDMSDEELAKKTGIKASDVRVVLNRLHNHGLFSYTRVRDRDSGWYSYIWKMSEPRLNDFVESVNAVEGADGGVGDGAGGEGVVDYLNSNSKRMEDGTFFDDAAPRQRFAVRRR